MINCNYRKKAISLWIWKMISIMCIPEISGKNNFINSNMILLTVPKHIETAVTTLKISNLFPLLIICLILSLSAILLVLPSIMFKNKTTKPAPVDTAIVDPIKIEQNRSRSKAILQANNLYSMILLKKWWQQIIENVLTPIIIGRQHPKLHTQKPLL